MGPVLIGFIRINAVWGGAMKYLNWQASVAFSIAAMLASTPALAQTCASPTRILTDAAGFPALQGTTCGHETSITSICGAMFGTPGQAWVGVLDVVAAATFNSMTFTGGVGYTMVAYLIPQASGCGDFDCTTSADRGSPMRHVNIPPGSYYLIVTGADFDAPNACGAFTMTRDGWLPVALQAFSVE